MKAQLLQNSGWSQFGEILTRGRLVGPDRCGSVGWALSRKAKGRWFDSHSGHWVVDLVPG